VSRVASWLLWVAAAAFLVLGVASFGLPGWASSNFPWRVGPFMAMTVGGWSLGTAAFAADVARDLRPARTYPLLVYVGFFAWGQLLVAIAFGDRLQLGALLTWPYLLGLVTALAGSLLAVIAWRTEPPVAIIGRVGVPGWARFTAVAFALFVGFLGAGTLIAGPNGIVAQGRVFPEAMSLFSIRAFSAFLFALALASASLVVARHALPYHELARAGLYLIVPTTLAAFLNLRLFDPARPGTIFYLATYVAVGVGLAAVLWQQRHDPAVHPT
jgi:hypothetical protein